MLTAPCNPVRLRITEIVVKNIDFSLEQVEYTSLLHIMICQMKDTRKRKFHLLLTLS